MAWCLKIADMHFHHRTVMQRINDLCQFLLVANTIEMFMWQIQFPLSIEVSSSFLHTGPFFSKLKGHPRQVRNRQFRPFSAHACIDPFPGAIPNALTMKEVLLQIAAVRKYYRFRTVTNMPDKSETCQKQTKTFLICAILNQSSLRSFVPHFEPERDGL